VRARTSGDLPQLLPDAQPAKLRQVRPTEYLIRFLLGAAVSVAAGVISKTVSARFGGAFLAFPSILPASLTLIQQKEGTRRADRAAIGAVAGSVGLVAFAIAAEAAFGRIEAFAALMLSLTAWVVTSFVLYGLLAFLRPESCDRAKD
jgi:hypothetical protein